MLRARQSAKRAASTHSSRLSPPSRNHYQVVNSTSIYAGNQAALRRLSRTNPRLQCKLQVGSVNDPLEAEAHRTADHVLHMPDPAGSADGPSTQLAADTVQRKCASCEEEEPESVHRKSAARSYDGVDAPPIVHETLASPGQPLGADARTFFEPRFGKSLGHVRVHADARASDSAAAIGARAYAVGEHIVFGAGGYAPSSDAGRQLMAHELTHVLQQSGAPSVRRACGPQAIGRPMGCEAGDHIFTDGPTFRFNINCDEWADGAEGGLRGFAKTLPATSNIQIDGYASIEGPEAFNTNLSCARILKTKALLLKLGVAESRMTRLIDHGATAGKVADRRSVVITIINAPAPPKTVTPEPDPIKPDPKKPEPPVPDPTPTASETPDEHPRLVIQVPFTPISVQLPIGGPGGVGAHFPAGQRNTSLDSLYQPNLAAGLNYVFQPNDIGFQLGGFVQFGGNVAAHIGHARPLSFSGHRTDFGGLNVQGYLQPAYVFFKKGKYQVSFLLQPGVGRTFDSPVPNENGVTYTIQGGFQVTKDIEPNRWQFFGTILGGVNKTKLDGLPADQQWQDSQGFIGISIGIQPLATVLDYPNK